MGNELSGPEDEYERSWPPIVVQVEALLWPGVEQVRCQVFLETVVPSRDPIQSEDTSNEQASARAENGTLATIEKVDTKFLGEHAAPSLPVLVEGLGVTSVLRFNISDGSNGGALSCLLIPVSQLIEWGLPLYTTLWFGLATAEDSRFDLQAALDRAKEPEAPKLRLALFKPDARTIREIVYQTPEEAAGPQPDIIGAINSEMDQGAGCAGRDLSFSIPLHKQVERLIDCLRWNSSAITNLQAALFKQALFGIPPTSDIAACEDVLHIPPTSESIAKPAVNAAEEQKAQETLIKDAKARILELQTQLEQMLQRDAQSIVQMEEVLKREAAALLKVSELEQASQARILDLETLLQHSMNREADWKLQAEQKGSSDLALEQAVVEANQRTAEVQRELDMSLQREADAKNQIEQALTREDMWEGSVAKAKARAEAEEIARIASEEKLKAAEQKLAEASSSSSQEAKIREEDLATALKDAEKLREALRQAEKRDQETIELRKTTHEAEQREKEARADFEKVQALLNKAQVEDMVVASKLRADMEVLREENKNLKEKAGGLQRELTEARIQAGNGTSTPPRSLPDISQLQNQVEMQNNWKLAAEARQKEIDALNKSLEQESARFQRELASRQNQDLADLERRQQETMSIMEQQHQDGLLRLAEKVEAAVQLQDARELQGARETLRSVLADCGVSSQALPPQPAYPSSLEEVSSAPPPSQPDSFAINGPTPPQSPPSPSLAMRGQGGVSQEPEDRGQQVRQGTVRCPRCSALNMINMEGPSTVQCGNCGHEFQAMQNDSLGSGVLGGSPLGQVPEEESVAETDTACDESGAASPCESPRASPSQHDLLIDPCDAA